jgi:hypothetical protein
MKKSILLLLIIFLQTSIINGQDFPGKDVELLFGAEIKVKELKPDLQKNGYANFYKDKDLKKIYSKTSVNRSKYRSLVNKVFVVIGIDSLKWGYSKLLIQHILTLKNDEIGLIYYKYDGSEKYSFPFEVIGGLQYPDDYLCRSIEETKDKFTGETTYRTPVLDRISFTKVIGNNDSTIYMSLKSYKGTVNFNVQGVVILFKDGSKLEFPSEKIDVRIDGRYYDQSIRYQYSAFIRLNEQDIEKLKIAEITDFRLYIYDSAIANGKLYQEYLKCIVEK